MYTPTAAAIGQNLGDAACQAASPAPTSAAAASAQYAGIRASTSVYDAPNSTPLGVESSCGIRSQAPNASTARITAASSARCRRALAATNSPRTESNDRLPPATCAAP